MFNPLDPDHLARAAANVYDALRHDGLADVRPTPRRVVDETRRRTLYRYLEPGHAPAAHERPVLLVPPLGAPAQCFDLRRGCSLAEHLLAAGHRTYLVEYGDIAFAERDLGLEHWIEDVIPSVVRRVSEDAGGAPVHVVGWCLGALMALLAVAADDALPVGALAMVAAPLDSRRVGLVAPLRPVDAMTGGLFGTAVYRALGSVPAPLVRRAFQLSAMDKVLTRPLAQLMHLHDRDFLAQIEAVDRFAAGMHAYPGRTLGQLYHRLFRGNDLARGRLRLSHRTISLDAVTVPVLAVAGQGDPIAPPAAAHAAAELLPGAPEVRLRTAPGGHLGVLTGRAAAGTTWTEIDRFLADGAPGRPARARLRVVA